MMTKLNTQLTEAHDNLRNIAIEAMKSKGENYASKVFKATRVYDKIRNNYNEAVNACESIGVKFKSGILNPLRHYSGREIVEKALGIK
jgi:hypothetical protein